MPVREGTTWSTTLTSCLLMLTSSMVSAENALEPRRFCKPDPAFLFPALSQRRTTPPYAPSASVTIGTNDLSPIRTQDVLKHGHNIPPNSAPPPSSTQWSSMTDNPPFRFAVSCLELLEVHRSTLDETCQIQH